jgi:peroxiredoxin
MTIQVGEQLPEGILMESAEFDAANGCPMPPQKLDVLSLAKGKKLVIFGVPGAFTPLCSAQHLPGYVAHIDELKAKGVDEVWCVAVNDAFVMAAWGREQKAIGKVRMMADGSAEYVKKLGLDRDLTGGGMGVRSFRYAMIVEDAVVKYIGVEASGKFEVSNVETVLAKL